MKKQILQLIEFHKTYLVNVEPKPALPAMERRVLRNELLSEEMRELKEAAENDDLVEVADAIVDILYVAYGTVLEYGLQDKIEALFDEVHASNMSKLDENGKPIYREDGKVLKGKNYFKPDIKGVLNG